MARRRFFVLAAGGILWRVGPSGPEIVIVHRPRRPVWSLPKGKLEPGEAFRDAAVREVEEETGLRARRLGFAGLSLYLAGWRPKLVLYWHMEPIGGALRFEATDEIDQVEWASPLDAAARIHHAQERLIVSRARPPASAPAAR